MENEIREVYLKEQEKLKHRDFFTTGYEDLDIFCRFLQGGNIMTIGGRPAMGKTSLVVSLTNHLTEKGKRILFFSIEMSKAQFVSRLVSEKTGASLLNILEGRVSEAVVNPVLDSFKDKEIFITDKACKIEDFEASVKDIKPEIVFIDYVQLIEAPKAPNRTEAINIVIQEIKRIAVENDTIVILTSQLSRAPELRMDKRPLLSDLRSSSTLEELSDIILMIYRESYYEPEPDYPKNEIIIAKNSFGPTGVITLDFKNGYFKNQTVTNTF